MYLHFREEVDDQHSGNDKSKADDGWQVGLLVESKHTDERNKYDAHGSPDAVGYADGQCAQGVSLATAPSRKIHSFICYCYFKSLQKKMVLAKRKRTTWVSHLIQHHFLMKPSDEWLQKYENSVIPRWIWQKI